MTCELPDFLPVLNDGVTGDTTLIVRRDGLVQTTRVDELHANWKSQPIEVWQANAFVAIKRIELHCTAKQIVRVLTFSGVVDCTSDYPLLKSTGKHYMPREFTLKSHLLHGTDDSALLKSLAVLPNEIECKEAYALGAFANCGTCCELSAESGRDWLLEDVDEARLCKVKESLPFATIVHDPVPPSNKYQLRLLCDERSIVTRYRDMFYNEHNELHVPNFIMHANLEIVRNFWDGCAVTGRIFKGAKTHTTVTARGKQLATDLWLLARRLGYNIVLYDCLSSYEYSTTQFELHCLQQPSRHEPNEIKRICEIGAVGEPRVVYSIETKTGRFNAAPGNIILGSK